MSALNSETVLTIAGMLAGLRRVSIHEVAHRLEHRLVVVVMSVS
jgi:hypothetical protein